MKRAFSIVELMIVVAILGILAAIVFPRVQTHAAQAREAVAKDSLRILRSAIKLYAERHGGIPPGYVDDDPTQPAVADLFSAKLVEGRYFVAMPSNPFNKLSTIKAIQNVEQFPAQPTGDFGWIYQPNTMTIKIDWIGTDSSGVLYFDY